MVKTVGGRFYYWIIGLWFIWALTAAGAGKNLPAGIKYFVMTSDSMAPRIPPGAVVVVRQQDGYEVGDVISFYARVEEKEVVVAHRIAAIGGNTYITAGDQNEAWDAVPVEPRLIVGKVITSINGLGGAIRVMSNKNWRWLTVAVPVILVIINELLKINKELKHEPTDRRQTSR